MRLLEGSQCRTIVNIEERQVQCSSTIIATSGVELRTVVGEGELVALEQQIKSTPGEVHMDFGVGAFALGRHRVCEPPAHFRIATRECWHEHGFGLVCSTTGRIDFR